MKKSYLISCLVLITLFSASCKKSYTCICQTNYYGSTVTTSSTTIKSTSPTSAASQCEAGDNVNANIYCTLQ